VTGVWLITRQFLNATITLLHLKDETNGLTSACSEVIMLEKRSSTFECTHWFSWFSMLGQGRFEVPISVLLQWQIWCWVQNVVVNLWSPLKILLFWWWGINFVDFQFHPAQFVKKVGQRMCLLRYKDSVWSGKTFIFNCILSVSPETFRKRIVQCYFPLEINF